MKRFFLSVVSLIFSQFIFAQVTSQGDSITEPVLPEIVTKLNIDEDPRLEKMLIWHIQQNIKIDGIEGYRVEIFFSSDFDAFDKAKKKKVEFLSLYPDNTVHIKYDAPNFRVRVGDFRTKNEALKLHTEIKRNYPVAFIVADIIDFPLMKQIKYERAD
jgi:hypothetical protein